jgi:ATP-binding cassette subfamily B protein IrtA
VVVGLIVMAGSGYVRGPTVSTGFLVATHDHDRAEVMVNSAADVRVEWVDSAGADPAGAVLQGLDELGDLSGWHFWVALEQAAAKQVRSEIRSRWSPGRHELKAQAYWIRGKSMGTVGKESAARGERRRQGR